MVALANASLARLKADIIFSSHCIFGGFLHEDLEKGLHDAGYCWHKPMVKNYHANEFLESLNSRWPGEP